MKKLCKLFKTDESLDISDSNLISMVIMVPLFVALLITTIDLGIYFNLNTQITNIARDGARTVAIFGGNQRANNPIAETYGSWDSSIVCPPTLIVSSTGAPIGRLSGNFRETTAPTWLSSASSNWGVAECQIAKIAEQTINQRTQAEVTHVACGPARANLNQTVGCAIRWHYAGLPLSMFSFVRLGGNQISGNDSWQTQALQMNTNSNLNNGSSAAVDYTGGTANTRGNSILEWNLAVGTAQSEVNMN